MPKQMNIDLEKVKITDVTFGKEGIIVGFHAEGPEGLETYTVDRNTTPHPDLMAVRDALAEHMLRMCEIDDSPDNPAEVTKVSFKWKDGGKMSAVISGKRNYSNSFGALALNTPVKFEESNQIEQVLDADTAEELQRLHRETIEYLRGKGAQAELFVGENGKLAKKESAEVA